MAGNSEAIQRVLATRKFVDVLGTRMSYLDTEQHSEKAVVFLHGNPTAAYLWRAIIPYVQDQARCIAPDLVGMGHSEKLKDPNKYHFVNHYHYLTAFLDKMNLPKKVVLVVHDWGSTLGFHWANQHRDRVAGIAFMEAWVRPVEGWSEFPDDEILKNFKKLASPAGEDLILQHNALIEMLPAAFTRKLTEEEMNEYRRPYTQPGDARRPISTFPRELPIKGHGPDEVIAVVNDYYKWLQESSELCKLYIHLKPGNMSRINSETVKNWPNLRTKETTGWHYLQEDSPDDTGRYISEFVTEMSNTGKI